MIQARESGEEMRNSQGGRNLIFPVGAESQTLNAIVRSVLISREYSF